jgi:3-hydroxyacyl-CoA dehydrogenase
MDLDSRLTHVAVIGAAGKMGSGITLLMAQEMARLSLLPENKGKLFRLEAIDLDPEALRGLQDYIHAQAVKAAEKNAVSLRAAYADRKDLVENSEIIEDFVRRTESMVWPSTDLLAAKGARIVFEAIVEKVPVKVDVLKKLRETCDPEAFFFTNTSSVPIGLLDKEVGLGGRIMGVHFYNPPPVQKLVETIRTEATRDDVAQAVVELGKRLRKTLIPSADVAGFIGNGHFIRDGHHAIAEAEKLAEKHGWPSAVWMINRVSQDWLLRPMGIFQLIDYVGVDVFQFIERVMDHYLDEKLTNATVDRMMELKAAGGQRPDGSQKPGFLEYERGKITGVYDPAKRAYVPLDPQGWTGAADKALGDLPQPFRPWKALLSAPDKDAALALHFKALAEMKTLGAELARAYHRRSMEIGKGLVARGVAAGPEDVNGVLTSGFYHLYGPINDYLDVRVPR